MNEDTLIKTIDLPLGQDWAWYADANIVGLGRHLCADGREQAISEVQSFWRRSCLRIVPDGASATLATQPMSKAQIREMVEAL